MARGGETVRLNAADPLNLVGIVLPGARVAAVRTNSIAYRDGAVVDDGEDPTGPAGRAWTRSTSA
jgi:ATP-dependent helicase Lhr and Lhr-like helicase